MRLLKKRYLSNSGLLSESELFDEQTFFKAFSKDFKQANDYVVIESPFITIRRASELAVLCRKLTKRGVTVKVYTRNSYHHDGSLIHQSIEGIRILKKAGVKVKQCNDLRHRKLAIIDGRILWEGSMNMLSQSRSREIMRRTESTELCKQMLSFTGLSSRSW